MPLTLITTVGGATSNSYCSRADADSYHEARLHSEAWTAAANETKDAALAWATRLLDNHFNWVGVRATVSQALGWPRHGAYDKDGWWIEGDVIPNQVRDATAELARSLISADPTALTGLEGFDSITVDVISLDINAGDRAEPIPQPVIQMINILGRYSSANSKPGVSQVRVSRS